MEHLYKEQQNEIGVRYTQDIHGILNQLGRKYYTSNQILNIILKVIRLKVLMVHEFISITLENSISRAPEKRGSSFLSHKENHEGLGLKNVERTITQYKGDIQYEWRKPYFITRIMLGF